MTENGEKEKTVDQVLLYLVENVIGRNFTKRQIKILGFIYMFTTHNQKMECHIPTLVSFEMAGVSKTKIRQEIEILEKYNVLTWNRKEMIFILNEKVDTWLVKKSEDYKRDRINFIKELNDLRYGSS